MASMSEDGGGNGYRPTERSVTSLSEMTSPVPEQIVNASTELSAPVESVTSPADTSSSSVQVQIINGATDRFQPDTASFSGESGAGSQAEGSDGGGGGGGQRSNVVVEVVGSVIGAASMVAASSYSSSHKPASVNPASTPNHAAHPRGYGSHHHNYGGHTNHGQGQGQGQGRGYQERNQQRNFNWDTNMQPHRGGYIQPSADNSTPYVNPPMPRPVQPFGSNVPYPDAVPPHFRGLPHPPFIPVPFYYIVPYPLLDKIRKQIDFYFSKENLVRDTYLRGHMDEWGWVPVYLIAGFNNVLRLTNDIHLILHVMQQSDVVEVQGDKMRRRGDWMRWLLPSAVQDSLASQLEGIGLDEGRQLQPGGGDRPPPA